MLIAFIAGWTIGSLSLYSYLILSAKEPPYPECMDCNASSCEGCSYTELSMQEYRRAA